MNDSKTKNAGGPFSDVVCWKLFTDVRLHRHAAAGELSAVCARMAQEELAKGGFTFSNWLNA